MVVNRTEATQVLRLMIGLFGEDLAGFALHAGRIGGVTQPAANGATSLQI